MYIVSSSLTNKLVPVSGIGQCTEFSTSKAHGLNDSYIKYVLSERFEEISSFLGS